MQHFNIYCNNIFVLQALQGVDAASFKSGGFHAEYVFQVAVSMSVDNIHPSDITIVGVSDDIIVVDSTTAGNIVRTNAQYVSVCVVSYTIKINTATAGFVNADTAYTTIISALTTSIQTKQFDKFLNDGAQSFQVLVLYSVVSPNSPDAISTSFQSTPTTNDANNSGDNSSMIIASICLVLACIVLILVCIRGKYNTILRGWWRRGDARYNSLDTESLHGSVHSGVSNNSDSGNVTQKMTASSLLGRTLMKGIIFCNFYNLYWSHFEKFILLKLHSSKGFNFSIL